MGFRSGTLGRARPPVDAVVIHELLSTPGSVLRVIVLEQLMTLRIHLSQEGQQSPPENVAVHGGIHVARKDTHTSPASLAYACPYVHL